MSQFRTVPIGNHPLLVIASSAMAFGVTHYYFNQADAGALAQFFGSIMLAPFHVIALVFKAIGLGSFTGQVAFIFTALLISYVSLTFILSGMWKLIVIRRRNQPINN